MTSSIANRSEMGTNSTTNSGKMGIPFLEERWSRLKLFKDELDTIVGGEILSEDDKVKERRSLIGKLFTERRVSKEMIKGTMGKIWHLSKNATFTEV